MVFTMRAGISDGFENRRCIILFEELYAEAIGLIKNGVLSYFCVREG